MAAVSVLTWEFRIPGCRSLKEKRTLIRSLLDRLRNEFHISAAETDFQDLHDRAEVTVALVTSEGRLAESLADRIDHFVAERSGMVVASVHRDRH